MVARVPPGATRLRRAAAAIAMAAAGAAGIVIACGPGDIADLTAGRSDSGADAADAADAPICIHASAPERPGPEDGPNVPPVVFAFENVRFDTSEEDGGAPTPRGLDLDMACTCADPKLEPESCIPRDSGAKRPCDGVDGRDNAAGPLLASIASTGKNFGPGAFQQQIQAGIFNVVSTLSGWNGLPDDPAVVLGVLLSAGVQDDQSDGGRKKPKFDGSDVWTITPDSVLGGADLIGKDCRDARTTCIAAKADATAYVRGGVLVAHLDLSLPIVTPTSSFTIEFVGATVTARLIADGASYRVAGEIDGRWPIERLLPSIARIPNPITPGHALCASDSGLDLYNLVKKNACEGMDLTANPALDRTNAPCDAISNAITFTAVGATVGTVVAPPNGNSECAGFKDSCDR